MMAAKMDKLEKLLTIKQTAARLGCSESTIRRHLLDGTLIGLQYRPYGRIRIAESEILRFLSGSKYQEPTK